MKTILSATFALVLFTSVVMAGNSAENITMGIEEGENYVPVINSMVGSLPEIDDYTPVHETTIHVTVGGLLVNFASDGSYYYALGSDGVGDLETYELDGTFVRSIALGTYYRGLFYNPNDGLLYIKQNSSHDLYTVDPVTGNLTFVAAGVAHTGHGNFAFVPETGLMYEKDHDTVHEIDLATGNTLRSIPGFLGTNWAIATNGLHLFAWDGVSSVFVYDFDGNLVETLTVTYPGGGGNWFLDHSNNLLWTGEGGWGNGNWYGYSGVEGTPPSDTCFIADVTILTPFVADNGGVIMFDLEVRNCGLLSLPVYAEMYPTIGDCATGAVFDFNMSKLLVNVLDPSETFVGHYFYNVGDVSGLGLSGCALNFDFGPAVDDWIVSDCDEFTFYSQFGSSGGPANWGTEWTEYNGNEANIPTTAITSHCYPNPFNATTEIQYALHEQSNVRIDIFNIKGQHIETLINGWREAGYHTAQWNASSYSSGIYFYKLNAGDKVFTKRMTLLK